jgi:serine/threonine protein kinase
VAESNLNDFMDVAEKQDDCRSMLSNFFGCLAGAVMYLHNNRIRHRDIKPENILIYQAKVYLTDFGISLDWEHLSRSTTTEDSGKTPLYCAPEVASQFAKRNSATDIWSLGCVFTEMLVVVRGYTKEELRTAFYKNSESRVFYRNSTVVHEWLNGRLLDSISVSSKSLTQITSTMLSLDHESRPKAHTVYDTLSSCPSNDSLNAITYCGECCQSIEATMSETHSDDDAWDPDLHEPVDKLHTTGSPPTRGQHGPLPEQMVTLSIEPPVLTTSTPTATHNLPLALQPLRDLPQPSKEQLLLSIKFSVWEPCTYNKKATFTLKSRDFAYPAHLVSCIKRKFAKASYLGNRVEATWTKQLRKEQPDLLEQIRSADESDVAPLLHLVLQSGLAVRPLSVVPWTGFQRVLATKFEEPRSRFRNAVLKLLILYGWTCQSPVFHTIRRGSVDDLAFVLAAGYNPNEEGIPLGGEMFDLADIDSRLRSPLFFAAHYGSLEKVQLLHESGVSHEPVIYPSGTDTALHHAVAGGNFEVVKFLYNTGNYKNTLMTPDSNGDTPISLARFEHQDLEIYQYLKLCRIREGYELAALQSR